MARLVMNTKAKVIIGLPQMAEALKALANKCPQIKHIIVLGPPQEGLVSFMQMVADPGDLFNETLPVSDWNNLQNKFLCLKMLCLPR